MIKSEVPRFDAKRQKFKERKSQFTATAAYKQQDYPHRLNLYDIPPTAEISLEDFEKWAIDRLRSRSRIFQSLQYDHLPPQGKCCHV
jgi:DNA primase large subunit